MEARFTERNTPLAESLATNSDTAADDGADPITVTLFSRRNSGLPASNRLTGGSTPIERRRIGSGTAAAMRSQTTARGTLGRSEKARIKDRSLSLSAVRRLSRCSRAESSPRAGPHPRRTRVGGPQQSPRARRGAYALGIYRGRGGHIGGLGRAEAVRGNDPAEGKIGFERRHAFAAEKRDVVSRAAAQERILVGLYPSGYIAVGRFHDGSVAAYYHCDDMAANKRSPRPDDLFAVLSAGGQCVSARGVVLGREEQYRRKRFHGCIVLILLPSV